mgnify:FL=1
MKFRYLKEMIAYPFHLDLIKQILNYEWSPIAEELKSLDRKIVLNSMVFKWDNVKKEFADLINI